MTGMDILGFVGIQFWDSVTSVEGLVAINFCSSSVSEMPKHLDENQFYFPCELQGSEIKA